MYGGRTLKGTYRVSYGIRPSSTSILLVTQEHVRAFRSRRQKPHPCAAVRTCCLIDQWTSSTSIKPLAKGSGHNLKARPLTPFLSILKRLSHVLASRTETRWSVAKDGVENTNRHPPAKANRPNMLSISSAWRMDKGQPPRHYIFRFALFSLRFSPTNSSSSLPFTIKNLAIALCDIGLTHRRPINPLRATSYLDYRLERDRHSSLFAFSPGSAHRPSLTERLGLL